MHCNVLNSLGTHYVPDLVGISVRLGLVLPIIRYVRRSSARKMKLFQKVSIEWSKKLQFYVPYLLTRT